MSNSTIYDVSRLAGVSTATVSRVFSDPKRVKESTCSKVYEAGENSELSSQRHCTGDGKAENG